MTNELSVSLELCLNVLQVANVGSMLARYHSHYVLIHSSISIQNMTAHATMAIEKNSMVQYLSNSCVSPHGIVESLPLDLHALQD